MSKIAIIGAGSVGATIAYAAMIRGAARQFALHDINRAKVEAEVLDLNHGLQFVPMATLEGSDDIGVCAGADVVVITAGAKQKPGQTRLEGYLGIDDVCLSVPSIVNRTGVETVLEVPLSEQEREGPRRSADTIRQAIRTLGF